MRFASSADRLDLERKFVLWLVALLTPACIVAGLLVGPRWASIVALMLLAAAMAVALAHYLLFKPVRQLVTVARAAGSGDFSKRTGWSGNDELCQLAFELDSLCCRLQTAQLTTEAHIAALEQLRHSDRIATLGRLASSVAHELGNPLNVIELRAQLISRGELETLQQAQQSAAVIVEQTRRMTRIIDEILSFARMQPAKIAHVDLAGVLRKAVALSLHISKRHHTNVELDLPVTAVEIDGDADKLLQVVVNLVVNGVQAMPGGGTLNLRVFAEHCAPLDNPSGEARDYVCIDVVDHGVGIPLDSLSKVFEPFFSTKSSAGGTGLGLSIAQGIVREHAGWISATSELGQGASFRVHLPKHGLVHGHAV